MIPSFFPTFNRTASYWFSPVACCVAFRQRWNERRHARGDRYERSIRMITRVTLRNAKWRKKKPRIAFVNRRVVPRGNECKCIEIQIIISSRRIVCPIAYTRIRWDTVGIGVCTRKRIKGWDKGRLCYFFSSVLVFTIVSLSICSSCCPNRLLPIRLLCQIYLLL